MTARLRPRFRMRVDLDADSVMELFDSRADDELPCVLCLYEHQVEFSVRTAQRHFWSPFLNLIIEPSEPGAVLYGKYGPNANVWTLFLGLYVAAGIVGAVGLIVAWSQRTIGQPITGFWLTVVCLAAACVVYAVGRVGRQLAHPQMVIFHELIESLFADHIVELHDEETSRG